MIIKESVQPTGRYMIADAGETYMVFIDTVHGKKQFERSSLAACICILRKFNFMVQDLPEPERGPSEGPEDKEPLW